ncbi:MAG: hypothetical protein WBQ69_13915 [Gallionella sp.]
MQTLSAEQQQNLVEIVNEEFGTDLMFDEFADVVLGLIEDISGFETAPPNKVNLLVNQLWRKYYVQESAEKY